MHTPEEPKTDKVTECEFEIAGLENKGYIKSVSLNQALELGLDLTPQVRANVPSDVRLFSLCRANGRILGFTDNLIEAYRGAASIDLELITVH